MFRDRRELATCYRDMVRHALTNFGTDDILRFLGKRLTTSYRGEVITDFKRRQEGIRIKHVVGLNSGKAYDKAHDVAPVRGNIHAVLRL